MVSLLPSTQHRLTGECWGPFQLVLAVSSFFWVGNISGAGPSKGSVVQNGFHHETHQDTDFILIILCEIRLCHIGDCVVSN